MKIAVIGSGKIGSTIARLCVADGSSPPRSTRLI
ncbi:MAG TPA: NAD(P)-binding domain-containing protein [Solirubrobacteraceae bacterium]